MGDMTVDELKDKKLWFLWSVKPGKARNFMPRNTDMRKQSSLPGSRGSSTGSRDFKDCYP